MADFSIDYSLLQQVQQKMHSLADQADSGGATGAFKDLGEAAASDRRGTLGHAGLSTAFNLFYRRSSSRTKDAKDGLNQLADMFASVANTFFDADAQLAGSAGLMGQSIGLSDWRNEKAAHDEWVQEKSEWDAYLEKIGADDYFAEHPDDSIRMVCTGPDAPGFCAAWKADDAAGTAPINPGEEPPKPSETPPTSYSYEDSKGKVDVTVELDDDNNVMKETQKITSTDGQSYTSTTVYDSAPKMVGPEGDQFDARDYTITTDYADGSTTTTKVVIDDDGSGTMTETDDDGNTTVSTRSGPDADWVEEDGGDDD
ncbi:serine/arginine repetitive matrix protein 2 [Streptomyces sp. NPDC001904]|uniref:serine/arginine repetitive matrix protein 2 n=1 Tax=Streptomyces sp. NPDC001904 TaxID=3154531 RepID=UPI003328C77E